MQPYEPFLGPPSSGRHEGRVPRLGLLDRAPAGRAVARLARALHVDHRGARRCSRAGEPFVYAYYDGIDKVAHEYGLGAHYEAELVWVDRLRRRPPRGAAAWRGAARHRGPRPGRRRRQRVASRSSSLSHASRASPARRALAGCTRGPGAPTTCSLPRRPATAADAWVASRDQILDEGWFGPRVSAASIDRLGDVVLAARGDVAFDDPADSGPFKLIARHGSLTAAEMLVPLVASHARSRRRLVCRA